MKEFLVFFSASNDALLTVSSYEDRAVAAASAVPQPVVVQSVDVDVASAAQLQHWNGRSTVECVAVDGGAVRQRATNPTLLVIDTMVMQLQVTTTKQFLVFYSGNNDPLLTIEAYQHRALARSSSLSKPIFVLSIDVDIAASGQLLLWNGTRTIECVTADAGVMKAGRVNPTLIQIDQMIDTL
ncbi:MAG: hypothetical protein L0387_20050 [Acidobacteria bacterium]|nr:hypothetical protein [Acidobacteriota bacterium]MCI0722233.1 hypothetical protein [Acidobacteriota bacterium]